MAMLSVGALAVGYLMMNVFSTSTNLTGDVCTTLFGSTSILTLTQDEVWMCVALSAVVVLLYLFFQSVKLIQNLQSCCLCRFADLRMKTMVIRFVFKLLNRLFNISHHNHHAFLWSLSDVGAPCVSPLAYRSAADLTLHDRNTNASQSDQSEIIFGNHYLCP